AGHRFFADEAEKITAPAACAECGAFQNCDEFLLSRQKCVVVRIRDRGLHTGRERNSVGALRQDRYHRTSRANFLEGTFCASVAQWKKSPMTAECQWRYKVGRMRCKSDRNRQLNRSERGIERREPVM